MPFGAIFEQILRKITAKFDTFTEGINKGFSSLY